jgi:NAD(P)H dehydrogenase (quinone)
MNWSGLPTVHVRPTVFLENFFFLDWAAESIARDDTVRLPFGAGRTSPVAVQDVAEVIAVILSNPAVHVCKVYELTGPRSQNIQPRSAGASSMSTCHWSSGVTRSFATAIYRSMSSSIC